MEITIQKPFLPNITGQRHAVKDSCEDHDGGIMPRKTKRLH